MGRITIEQLQRHVKTHTERSADDHSAVDVINYFFRSRGKINSNFAQGDKWPNTDGNFELVPDPISSRRPKQNFTVQIKGTSCATISEDGVVKYQLQSLAFPAYIATEITLDPGILFLVLNPEERGKERVFWKYISPQFITSINFNNNSAVIKFTSEDEVENTKESVDAFVKKLEMISDTHSYMKQLESREYTKKDVIKSVIACCEFIEDTIEMGIKNDDTRDNLSKKILMRLQDLCQAALLLNAMDYYETSNLRLAWEFALTDIRTKFLATFLMGLRYIGIRVPDDGQYERLMLKYYGFLWKIRNYLSDKQGLSVLENLEKFPREINNEDEEYNRLIADAIEKVAGIHNLVRQERYYIQKKVPFYVGKERYFEITLQLADKYATKYNRLTVYSKEDISSNYSIQIGCVETEIPLWGNLSQIKVITDWKVSIQPASLNKMAKIIKFDIRISARHNEYEALMEFLTKTGINLLDFIDFQDERFTKCIIGIYEKSKTANYKDVLITLHTLFHNKSQVFGKNTVRYVLLRLHEELLEDVLPQNADDVLKGEHINISRACYPFEKNPVLYNMPGRKTNGKTISKDVLRIIGANKAEKYLPYIRMKHLVDLTGELYQKREVLEYLENNQTIIEYNKNLLNWDIEQGLELKEENGYVCLNEYVNYTVHILKYLLRVSENGNTGQKNLNQKFLSEMNKENIDQAKIMALQKVFTESGVLMIYGAAGTGKTTLMNHITQLMQGRSKLYLTKTHTALENLKRRITTSGDNSKFMGLDQFIHSNLQVKYDVVFMDECSTIDNRTMVQLLKRIDEDTLLVFAGDIYQIESIDFGNWFFYAKKILPEKSIVELNSTWRTQEKTIKELWDAVRFFKPLITEMLVIDGPFSENIGYSLFEEMDPDEVVLCLNCDGKFGLNSINSYFQDANPTKEVFYWSEWKYKVGDRILFNESKRFPILYNNLKGTIVDITQSLNCLTFTIEIPIILTGRDVRDLDLEIVSNEEESTKVRFSVYVNDETKEDEDYEEARMKSIVPFQLAYAVSIHKAQGLEYKSIKVVIPNSNSERITHGIFYTAITRTQKCLKIYWSSDTMHKVISSFEEREDRKVSLDIIRAKIKE